MVKTMLDLDVFRNGKTITVPVTMAAYHHFLYGSEETILNIDLDKGNVDALCFLDKDGFYQPYETDTLIVEFNGGRVSFNVLDIEYNMFEYDCIIDNLQPVNSDDDLIHPHALIKFKMQRRSTPKHEFNYDEFNSATKAILDALYQNANFADEQKIEHNAWCSEDGKEEYVSSIPGDMLYLLDELN